MNLAASVLSFREGLEAALIIAILLTYLKRAGYAAGAAQVWAGAGAAALLTAVFIAVLQVIGATFTYPAQGIFEGVTSLLAVVMVTSMTFWMARQARHLKGTLEHEVRAAVAGRAGAWGLFAVAFLAVGREGVETGLFLAAAAFATSGYETLAGSLAGLLAAAAVAWGIYAAGARLNLRLFFRVSGVLLVFFGAAMLRYAVQEFEEVGLIPPLVERVWDAGAWLPDAEGPGAVLAVLTGYTAHPSLAQLLAYSLYFAAVVAALTWPRLAALAGAVRGRRPWLAFTTLGLLAGAALLSGCEGGAAAATGPLPAGMQEVVISARDNVFEPKDVKLTAGQKVRITFVNDGKNVHEPEIKDVIPETKLAAGQRKSFDVTPKAGSFRLYCELHESQMNGTVTAG